MSREEDTTMWLTLAIFTIIVINQLDVIQCKGKESGNEDPYPIQNKTLAMPKASTYKKPEGKIFEFLRDIGHSHYSGHSNYIEIEVPHVDANGCSRVGELVCGTVPSYLCVYRVCTLATESISLWHRPIFDAVATACPAGRGLSTTFCNNNRQLLRQLGLTLGSHGHQHYHHHQSSHFVTSDPCIVISDVCDGDTDPDNDDDPVPIFDVLPQVPDPLPAPTTTTTSTTTTTTTTTTTPAPTTPTTTPTTTTTTTTTATRAAIALPPVTLPAATTTPNPTTTTQSAPSMFIRDSGCPDPFLKTANRHSQGGALVPGPVSTEEGCKQHCMQNPTCRAIDFDHTRRRCFTYTEHTQSCVLQIQDATVDHYLKTSCQQHAGAAQGFHDCFPGYQVRGATLRHNVNGMPACQLQCSLDPSCQGIDFDSAHERCWFHSIATVCAQLIPSMTVQHCRRVDCGTKKPDVPAGFSQVSIGFQQKGGVHLTAQYSRHGCLQTCLYSKLCAAVDYNIDDGSCWHIAADQACGAFLPVPHISNYRKQGVMCQQTHTSPPSSANAYYFWKMLHYGTK